MDHGLRFFTILSSNNSAAALSERATDMKPEDELLLLRREVRDSVFRAERLHRAGIVSGQHCFTGPLIQ